MKWQLWLRVSFVSSFNSASDLHCKTLEHASSSKLQAGAKSKGVLQVPTPAFTMQAGSWAERNCNDCLSFPHSGAPRQPRNPPNPAMHGGEVLTRRDTQRRGIALRSNSLCFMVFSDALVSLLLHICRWRVGSSSAGHLSCRSVVVSCLWIQPLIYSL
ncbi:hypothetical protein BKA57DRAFT_297486 [Linnemannia elongata]|nr:hypothetical protein BKA57DRAFT_297486 [Linnemannia elongata]